MPSPRKKMMLFGRAAVNGLVPESGTGRSPTASAAPAPAPATAATANRGQTGTGGTMARAGSAHGRPSVTVVPCPGDERTASVPPAATTASWSISRP